MKQYIYPMFWVSLVWLLLSFGWVFAQVAIVKEPPAEQLVFTAATTTPAFVKAYTEPEQVTYSQNEEIIKLLTQIQTDIHWMRLYK